MSLDQYVIRRGRPKSNKPDKFVGMMRMTERLKEYLFSMKGPNETLAECCLRLLTSRGITIGELSKKVDALNLEIESQVIELDAAYVKLEEVKKRYGLAYINVEALR